MPGLTEHRPEWGPAAVRPWPGSLPEDFPGLGGLDLGPGRVTNAEGAEAFLTPGPKGFAGLSLIQAGKTIHLTSALDPAAEDRALVERMKPAPQTGVLCLGLGLGYQLEELARRLAPEAPLWVMESRPELAACALLGRDLSALFKRPGFRLFVGPFAGQPWPEEESPPSQILWRPATRRHFAPEYPIRDQSPSPRPRPAARRLLLFQSGYFLDKELHNAAEELGLNTSVWNFQRGSQASGDNFKELLALLKSFRPDLVLTVNHLGFDAEGLMDDLFTRLNLPVASWFVDSPAFILGSTRPSPLVRAFSWDRDYLETLRANGFQQVSYLPLASDPNFFRPSPGLKASRPLAFVGDSMTTATAKYLGKLGLEANGPEAPAFLAAVDQLAEDFLNEPDLLPKPAGLKASAEKFNLPEGTEALNDLAALLTWRASRLWRLRVLSALPPGDLTVAGDSHWRQLLNLPAKNLVRPLDYYRDLGPFYQSSQVNLNITSAQMKTGLNQRVFDVPAAGAFLLTDRREQLFELFEAEREVICYRDPEEARELADWYLKHPAAKDSIIRAARRRILGEHLYSHRLARLLKEMES